MRIGEMNSPENKSPSSRKPKYVKQFIQKAADMFFSILYSTHLRMLNMSIFYNLLLLLNKRWLRIK